MQSKIGKEEQSGSSILINIVFALYAQASYSIVKCYYELSKRLGSALVYEENRVGYLTDEMRLMVKTHDEVAANIEEGRSVQTFTAFEKILEHSSLALCLKTVSNYFICLQTLFLISFLFLFFLDLSGFMFNWFAKYNNKPMDNIKFLSTSEGSSIS